jgi:hypothetical protein
MESKWLEFKKLETPGFKTRYFQVLNKKKGEVLGTIEWGCAWRQYIYVTRCQQFLAVSCLRDIAQFIEELMEERKCSRK